MGNKSLFAGVTLKRNAIFLAKKDRISAEMRAKRFFPDSEVVNGSLFVIGGWGPEKSTEFVSASNPSVYGTDLPIATFGHCTTMVNSTHILLTGGYETLQKSYFYNVEAGTWTEGPDLPDRKGYHTCGTFNQDGKPVVVIAGGSDDFKSYYRTVYFLDIDTMEWINGKLIVFIFQIKGFIMHCLLQAPLSPLKSLMPRSCPHRQGMVLSM